MRRKQFSKLPLFAAVVFVCGLGHAESGPVCLAGADGVRAVFEHGANGYLWTCYEDVAAGVRWSIAGPRFSLQTPDGRRTGFCDAPLVNLAQQEADPHGVPQVILDAALSEPPVEIRQTFSFCADGRTLRMHTSMRAAKDTITIQRVGLLEVKVADQIFEMTGPSQVSCPIFGARIFGGIEHPSASCQADGDMMYLAQHSYAKVAGDRVDLPAAVFGSASAGDAALYGEKEGLRRAFLRYLDTVRVKPADMHVHYNDWWTAPVPSSEAFVLENIATLRRDLYDQTGFFFDSYAMDMGWSDPHSVWQIDKTHFPDGFAKIRDALAQVHARPGLWVSPSSLYPPALDNKWLESAGYEVAPRAGFGLAACLAVGARYQTAFKEAVLNHARTAGLAHVKFDGFIPDCDVASHGHPVGPESWLPIAQGLMEVFDALRAHDPNIALEPTCFGYHPSPWWLMHVPFIIGPFGDDSPRGRCPCPEWVESMTTARDVENLTGRDAFLMPSSALQCFDIIVQCPGPFQNHAAMAIGRGHWFISSYINPKFMERDEWRFFADLIAWARHNRAFLEEPLPIGGDPAKREPYGYAFFGAERRVICLRNPWIEEAPFALPETMRVAPFSPVTEVRTLYPRRECLARVDKAAALPEVRLGPYETVFVEMVPTSQQPQAATSRAASGLEVNWQPASEPGFQRIEFDDEPAAFGPSWTSPDGDAKELFAFEAAGTLTVAGGASAELCVLCEGAAEVAHSSCSIAMDGAETPVSVSTSVGAFAATGKPPTEDWVWFTTPVPDGRHEVRVRVELKAASSVAVFIRGAAPAAPSPPPFGPGPGFPLYHADQKSWSRTIVPAVSSGGGKVVVRKEPRRITKIHGVYLDALEWTEASAGWGEARRNRSVMEKPMTIGGRRFLRGIGTHANSRIVYAVPSGFATFAATIGYDQEVQAGSVVFVVKGDDTELFRSPVMRRDSAPMDIRVPIGGISKLVLVVEDAGDGIAADHADWADARFLK